MNAAAPPGGAGAAGAFRGPGAPSTPGVAGVAAPGTASPAAAPAALTGAAAHAARKDLARVETRMARVEALRSALHAQMADAHTDHERLMALAAEDAALADEAADLETRWLDLAEALET